MICTFEKKIFENQATGYCIVALKTNDNTVPPEAQSKYARDKLIHFTGVGYGIPATDAIDLEIVGKWEKNKHGVQMVIEHFAEVIPPTIEGIIGYLSSELINGVSEITAKKITDRFGLNALEIIEKEPDKLNEIKGLSHKKIFKIVKSYSENKGLRNIVSFLSPFGITIKKAVKIQNEFGDKAMEILNEQPFKLCNIHGFGFKTVDAIAMKVKCKPNDKMRIAAAAKYVLMEADGEGHIFLEHRALRDKCYELLNNGFETECVTRDEIYDQLIQMIRHHGIINNNGNLYHPFMFDAEVETARKIANMAGEKSKYSQNSEKEINSAQAKFGITLSPAQVDAVKMCFENRLSIITGGPGTGKTTVLKIIIDVYQKLSGNSNILLTAPTGRAAKKMAESTGFPLARTLHSALGILSDEDEKEKPSELSFDFIIVDEMSMVDLKLASKLFENIKADTHVLLVGDCDQLPSIGAGNVFRDMLKSECVPATYLDVVFRQSGSSRIALNAQKIRNNESKLLYGNDFDFVDVENDAEAAEVVKTCYLDEIKKIGIDNVQILSCFRSRGDSSVFALNDAIREKINPFVGERNELFVDGRKLRLNDRILQVKNKNGVNNGDVGNIRSVYEDEDDGKHAVIEFSDGTHVDYTENELDIIELAYAMTIHKSQGSEYSTVIIPILKSFYIMLRRNLIYTAITRAKKKVVLIGQKQALMMAIHKDDVDKRNSLLGARIKKFYNEKEIKK